MMIKLKKTLDKKILSSPNKWEILRIIAESNKPNIYKVHKRTFSLSYSSVHKHIEELKKLRYLNLKKTKTERKETEIEINDELRALIKEKIMREEEILPTYLRLNKKSRELYNINPFYEQQFLKELISDYGKKFPQKLFLHNLDLDKERILLKYLLFIDGLLEINIELTRKGKYFLKKRLSKTS